MNKSLDITQQFVVMSANKLASIEINDDTLYQRLEQNYHGFQGCELISCHEFKADWPTWEMHPKGDELVVLLAGTATMLLKHEQGQQAIDLTQVGQYVIVPKATWHTAKITAYAKLLFVTPGEGTQNQASPD